MLGLQSLPPVVIQQGSGADSVYVGVDPLQLDNAALEAIWDAHMTSSTDDVPGGDSAEQPQPDASVEAQRRQERTAALRGLATQAET